MDEQTRGILQSLLDISNDQRRTIAQLQAMSILYQQVIVDVLARTDALENLTSVQKEACLGAISAADQIISHASSRENFDTLMAVIADKLSR